MSCLFRRLKRGGDTSKRIICRQHVVGIQYPDDIARRHLDAFVDGIVHSLITFG